jgi:hypothetical protein
MTYVESGIEELRRGGMHPPHPSVLEVQVGHPSGLVDPRGAPGSGRERGAVAVTPSHASMRCSGTASGRRARTRA